MKNRTSFLKIAALFILTVMFLTGIAGQSLGATGQANDIQFNQRLDTVPEQQIGRAEKPTVEKSAPKINIKKIINNGINVLKENLKFVAKSIGSLWNSMPNWARGLIKGIAVGIIAAAAIVGLAFLGIFGAAAAIAGVVVAIVAGVVYGLIVGGDGFQWGQGLLISIMAGLGAAIFVELAGVAVLNKLKIFLSFMGEEGWTQSTIRSFALGGLVNLTSYSFTHDKLTLWGIIGSFIVGGITGALYGQALVPWLTEARYITALARYRKLLPLANFLKGRLGHFMMFYAFGGGIIGGLTTIVQNGFIGEKTTPSGLLAGIISGVVAALLIRSSYSGLSKAIVKQCVREIAENGVLEYLKIRVQNGLEKIRGRNRNQANTQKG